MSFFTDAASEMIVSLLPAFVLALGGTKETLGIIEGCADSVAGLFKLVSGSLADRAKRRKPLVVLGYGVSSVVKPLMALALAPWHVFAVRFLDRLGKGVRTSPRDALVADVTSASDRGRAFGLQRSLDHLGSIAGPLIAWAWLRGGTSEPAGVDAMRSLFWFAAIPGALALLTLVGFVKEPARAAPAPGAAPRQFTIAPPKDATLRRFLLAHLVFGLGAATDAFLLVRAHELGVPLAHLPLLTAALHVVKTLLSTPFGALSDRISRRGMIVAGWTIYAAIFGGFALASSPLHVWALFAGYGLHHALVEGAERAYVSELAPAGDRGRAFGSYHFVTAITALPASWLFGHVMRTNGSPAAFTLGASLTGAGALLLALPALSGLRGVSRRS